MNLESEEVAKRFNKEDYILTFSVEGVNVFVTDIHRDVYVDLEVLFIIEKGLFKQYFTKKAFERALNKGVQFYGDKDGFDRFENELNEHCRQFQLFFEREIKTRDVINVENLQLFFDYTIKLCKEYTKMNVEYTDKAFTLKEQNKIIEENLMKVSSFKDKIRAFMNIVLFEEEGYSSYVFNILSNQFSVKKTLLENITQRELLDLFNGRKPLEAIVLKRQDIFVTTYDDPVPYENNVARAIAQKFENELTDISQITGQIACRGKVSGIVKVIPVDYTHLNMMNSEIKKMRKGDILVAKTTAPELIVACEKASAIVTDMGGFLSHAAIVSREFGIPCIVGTTNATLVLHDGDEVEVDADNGIVRIIKKYV